MRQSTIPSLPLNGVISLVTLEVPLQRDGDARVVVLPMQTALARLKPQHGVSESTSQQQAISQQTANRSAVRSQAARKSVTQEPAAKNRTLRFLPDPIQTTHSSSTHCDDWMAPPPKFPERLESLCRVAAQIATMEKADAMVLMVERRLDWEKLRQSIDGLPMLLAANDATHLTGAAEHGFPIVEINLPDSPIYERLGQAMLECVADDLIHPGACVVALYCAFESPIVDSISVIRLDEHLGRLTARDLRQLETRVPLDTLKMSVDLAVDIGREGREGKPVGALLVVGDHRNVLKHCHPLGFDPVRGYNVSERKLEDAKVREALKEIAQLDGAFVIAADGTVAAACQHISAPSADVTLSKGLGARHWAAASISRATSAVAISVSESNGTVRLFQNGEVILRIEPFRRAMKWKDFEFEPQGSD